MSDPNGLHWSDCPMCGECGINEDDDFCRFCQAEFCPDCKEVTMKQFARECPKCKTSWCAECGEFAWTSEMGCKHCGFQD